MMYDEVWVWGSMIVNYFGQLKNIKSLSRVTRGLRIHTEHRFLGWDYFGRDLLLWNYHVTTPLTLKYEAFLVRVYSMNNVGTFSGLHSFHVYRIFDVIFLISKNFIRENQQFYFRSLCSALLFFRWHPFLSRMQECRHLEFLKNIPSSTYIIM